MKTATASGMVLLGVSAVLAQVDRVIAPTQTEKSLRDVAAERPPAARQSAPDIERGLFGYSDADFGGGGAPCPLNSALVGQPASTAGGTYFHSDVQFCSAGQCGRVTAENFPRKPTDPGLTEPIRGVSWYGSYVDARQNGCVKSAHTFRIQFHCDDGTGLPRISPPVATFNVTASARVVGTINWMGSSSACTYLFWVTLPSPVNLDRGFVSICGTGSPDCWFVWGPSTDGGDATVYRWWETQNLVLPSHENDVAYCLGRHIPGACCNDWTGICNPAADDFSCFYEADLGLSPPGGRFTSGLCASLDPLCGQMVGACCKPDETCVPNLTRTACEQTLGAYWRGPQTTCAQCCWIPDCPAGTQLEAEPCGQNTNSGCRVTPPILETINFHGGNSVFYSTVCGTVWADAGAFDEDWYEFTAVRHFGLTIQNVNTQVPIRVTLLTSAQGGPPNCDDLHYYPNALHAPCEVRPPWDSPILPRGRYWIWVVPEDGNGRITDHYPCGAANEYSFDLLLEIGICCPPPCQMPGVTFLPENEPDYCTNPAPDTFNSGCDQTPPGPYLPITDNFECWCSKSGWYPLGGPTICHGDLDCDGRIDGADIRCLAALPNFPLGCNPLSCLPNWDCNGDGVFNVNDVPCLVLIFSNVCNWGLCAPPARCVGDMDCSGQVDFADINPFVLYLSDFEAWLAAHRDCNPRNGDINDDGHCASFGDINPFVALLAGSAGQPIPCPRRPGLVLDTDWYQFQIVAGPKTASIFVYSDFGAPLSWELYQASAGCGAGALQRVQVLPCFASDQKTFCLPNGTYWLRVAPDEGVECGKEYALGLEEFLGCSYCAVTCPTPNTPENEACGDNTNGGCNSTPNAFEEVACDATTCATTWAHEGRRDTDWFTLVLTASRYLIFTLHTEVPVLTGFMDTSVANCSYLYGYWVNVESCTAEPESWHFVDSSQQPVLFAAGAYWFTVFPDDGEDPIFYSYPCNRPAPFDLNTYWFEIECRTTPPASPGAPVAHESVSETTSEQRNGGRKARSCGAAH